MKTFFIKALMMIMAVIAAVEGFILFLIAAGRISPDSVASFYYYLSETPKARNTVAGIGAALVLFGLGLLIAAFRIRGQEKPILLEKDGKTITIYRSTVIDFVNQLLGQDKTIDNFTTEISQKGKHALEIVISPMFKAVDSVPHELERIEKSLKDKISHVFELTEFNIVFQVKGVRAAAEKAEEPPAEIVAVEKAEEPKDEATAETGEAAAEDVEKAEEPAEEEEAKEKSFLQRMFSANLYEDRFRRRKP